MRYILLLILICAAIVAYILARRRKASRPPIDVYVCSECGMKNCICRKENKPDSENS